MDWNFSEALSYYQKQGAPGDQSALIGLLREIQQNHGGSIPKYVPELVAQAYQVKESLIFALIKRIPALHLSDVCCLEICSGANCVKATELAKYAEQLHAACGKGFALKFSPCMRMCGKGPNIRWNGQLYNKADKALLRKLLTDAGIHF